MKACLRAGVNGMGDTLMNETISCAAGASHGQTMLAMDMEAMLRVMGRLPQQRSTAQHSTAQHSTEYGIAPEDAKARARAVSTPVEPVRIILRKREAAKEGAVAGGCAT